MDEWELLRRFAQEGSQEAFAEVVRRQLDFVYSCARRQVRSPELAQEVAQAVFLELARQAATLERGSPLSSWLYLVTRRAALNALRGELRRQAREHAAYELSAMNHEPSVWQKLEPLLDEALETLHPRDRSALLLRYFENKPLREIGAVLGASEDAAQKRVMRALDHLRTFFAKQGVPITAAGIAAHLATNAVEAAPAALGGLISSATGTFVASGASVSALVSETTHAFAMTTLQKSCLAAAVAVIGLSLYEVRALAGQQGQLAALEKEVTGLAAREIAARQARDVAQGRLAAIESGSGRSMSGSGVPGPATESVVATLMARVDRMKQELSRNVHLRIPELGLLDEEDWLQVARERPIDSDDDLRASLGRIRVMGKSKLGRPMTAALRSYLQANDDRLPITVRELQTYFQAEFAPADLAAMLDRYRISPAIPAAGYTGRGVQIVESEHALPDRDYDFQLQITGSFPGPGSDPRLSPGFIHNSVPGRLAPKPVMYPR